MAVLVSACGSSVTVIASDTVVAVSSDTSVVDTSEPQSTTEAPQATTVTTESSSTVASPSQGADSQLEPTEPFQRYEYVYTESRWIRTWPDFSVDIGAPTGPDGEEVHAELVTQWTVVVDELNDRAMVDRRPALPPDVIRRSGAPEEVLEWASQFEIWPLFHITQRFIYVDGEIFTQYFVLDDPTNASPWWGYIFMDLREEAAALELDPGLEHVAAALGAPEVPESVLLANGDLLFELDVDEDLVNEARKRLSDVSVLVSPVRAIREQARLVTDPEGLLREFVMVHDQTYDEFDLIQYRLTVTDRFAPAIPSVSIEWTYPKFFD